MAAYSNSRYMLRIYPGHRQEDRPLAAPGDLLRRVPHRAVQVGRLPLQAGRAPGPIITHSIDLKGFKRSKKRSTEMNFSEIRRKIQCQGDRLEVWKMVDPIVSPQLHFAQRQ